MNTISTYTVEMEMRDHPDVTKSLTLLARTFDDAKARAEHAEPGFIAHRVLASNGYTDYSTEENS